MAIRGSLNRLVQQSGIESHLDRIPEDIVIDGGVGAVFGMEQHPRLQPTQRIGILHILRQPLPVFLTHQTVWTSLLSLFFFSSSSFASRPTVFSSSNSRNSISSPAFLARATTCKLNIESPPN